MMVSKAFYNDHEEAFKHLHLDPVSFIKQQKNIHSIAMECVDQLPINNLTKIYKNIVDFSEGRTTVFYAESAQYMIWFTLSIPTPTTGVGIEISFLFFVYTPVIIMGLVLTH